MSNLPDTLSLYWLIVPSSEISKLKRKGKVLLSDHDKIEAVLDNRDLFDYAWEQSTHKYHITQTSKSSIKEGERSVLLLSDIDLKKIKKVVYIKTVVYQDYIEEKNIGKIFGIRRY